MSTNVPSNIPGCRYDIFLDDEVRLKAHLPSPLMLKDWDEEGLETRLAEAVDAVLAPYFKERGVIKIGDEVVAKIIGPVTLELPKVGWGLPFNSRKAHYFNNSITSLCGKWAFGGELEDKNHEHPENCAACMKKRAKL